MTLTVEFSGEAEETIDKLSKRLGLCHADTITQVLGTAVYLYEQSDKGHKVAVVRRWPRKSTEVLL